jgi:hypothetical protein
MGAAGLRLPSLFSTAMGSPFRAIDSLSKPWQTGSTEIKARELPGIW